MRGRICRYLEAQFHERSASCSSILVRKSGVSVGSVQRSARCKDCPTDAWIDAIVSFSFAMFMESEKRDLRVTVDESFRDLATNSLDDAFCNLPLQVHDQIIVGMLVWITGSIARLEQKVDRLDTAVDGLTKAVEDLTVGVGKLVRW